MDTLAVVKALDILEGEGEMVVLPPFYYGAASYAVEPPEGLASSNVFTVKDGEFQAATTGPDALLQYFFTYLSPVATA